MQTYLLFVWRKRIVRVHGDLLLLHSFTFSSSNPNFSARWRYNDVIIRCHDNKCATDVQFYHTMNLWNFSGIHLIVFDILAAGSLLPPPPTINNNNNNNVYLNIAPFPKMPKSALQCLKIYSIIKYYLILQYFLKSQSNINKCFMK